MQSTEIFCFRLPELVDGDIVVVAVTLPADGEPGEIVSELLAGHEAGIREEMGVGSNRRHNVYNQFFGLGRWFTSWLDYPDLHLLNQTRATLGLPVVDQVIPNERTADDLVNPMIEEHNLNSGEPLHRPANVNVA